MVPSAAADEPDVSVVVPVYRNAATLEALHDRLRRVFEAHGLTYELLFVDDACPEGSRRVIEALAERDGRVAGLILGRNVGQHRAVLTGLAHARGRRAVIMDADLQDPPEAIPALLARLDTGPAAVFAGRRGRYESPLRLLTSRLFKTLLHLLSGVPADAGIFVALDRRMVGRLLSFPAGRPFVVAMIGCGGLPLASIPVRRATRPTGESAYSTWRRLTTGGRAIGWVLAWKLRRFRRGRAGTAAEAPIAARIGARFALARGGAELRAGVS